MELRYEKTNKQKIFIVVLVLMLFGAIFYILYDWTQEKKQQELTAVYQQGAQTGYQNAIVQLMSELPNCKPVPIYANNITYNVIATECFNQQQFLSNRSE